MSLRFRAAGLSDVGRVRTVNEDSFAVLSDAGLYVVADGMGGHGNGEVASRVAVRCVREALGAAPGGQRRVGRPQPAERLSGRLTRAIREANAELLREVEDDPALSGMGTTLVALLVDGAQGAIAHVGDSRAYRLRDGVCELLTHDHTWVAEQVSAGNISESQARDHPFKSVVTRALGTDAEVEVELLELSPAAGDRYLLCSDGLTAMLSDEQIDERLAGETSPEAVCRQLVRDANAGGGLDNITVVVVSVEGTG